MRVNRSEWCLVYWLYALINYLRYMYISFALGLIVNAKQRQRILEYGLS